MRLLDLFHEGGFIMYPLLIFSVLAWSIGLYKIYFLTVFRREFQTVRGHVRERLPQGKVELASVKAPASITEPFQIVTSGQHKSKEEMTERLWRRLADTNSELKDHLWILGSISSSAPFIGLFGTVVGIMDSFKAIGSTGKSGFSVVAAGISESLVATAAGIIVAVVALLFYNYLQTKVNRLAQDVRVQLEEIGDQVLTAQGK